MSSEPKIPSAWKRELVRRPDYRGGWWMPVVCTGGGAHAPRILSHAFESTNGGVAYTAPFQTVRQTRASEAIGVPAAPASRSGWHAQSQTAGHGR